MLVTFKSKGSGDVQMFAENALALFEAMGRSLGPMSAPRGIIPAPEVATALEALRRASQSAPPAAGDDAEGRPRIGLAQRAFPMIALLESAQRRGADVVWGV